MVQEPIVKKLILAIFPPGDDRMSLSNIFSDSDWKLQFTHSLRQFRAALKKDSVQLVMSEARLSDGHCWKDLLRELENMSPPPPLIVADRLADEALWAEVLNLGAYDLLITPFDAKEVLHVVNMAWRFHRGAKPANSEPHAAPARTAQATAC